VVEVAQWEGAVHTAAMVAPWEGAEAVGPLRLQAVQAVAGKYIRNWRRTRNPLGFQLRTWRRSSCDGPFTCSDSAVTFIVKITI
jgi:hypothetical protein